MSTAKGPLTGRTALVTGARVGIGAACALALAEAGADVIGLGRSPMPELEARIAQTGRRFTLVQQDLSDIAGTRRTATEVTQQHRIDVLVNNAGIIRRAPAAETEWEDWRAVLDLNIDAVFALTQAVGRQMLARGDGAIVSIASLLSFQGGILVPAYAASKHAVVGMTKALANEWASGGVRVNAVAPGYIATDNTAALRADPERESAIRARIPASRWGHPRDIAGPVVFLAGDQAAYVNGHVLVVDGGWMGR